ncbi:TetR/AcrR family transcriptional regulator (plasmid) [Streptomyces sp. NBC_00190]|uniref:TetR/AcrR family transcriptional regulator n=1 Tax=unclassified Streptomyces TaxID=2593676 RepID=UPI002E2DB7FF|nr:TetR/AcrR family transcriptional regulator [Streptomyces sp. NBC_00190]WSZ45763.1 TetR/AcrR family transcriptional regulator [Streptomyces sp. NBC_00868]
MVKQERAARTREALVQAAAAAFDCTGYEATTLARISKTVGISTGALTFHFPAKDDLADAVLARGASAVRAAAERTAARREPPLRSVVALSLEIARLLETDATVRAAARLARERVDGPALWPSLWLPTLDCLLTQAAEGELRPGADHKAVLALVAYLVTGAEAHARNRAKSPGARGDSAEEQLTRIWDVVLPGISDGDRAP